MTFRTTAICLLLAVLPAFAVADVLILDTGKSLKIKSYYVEGESIYVDLNNRSDMVIPIQWVREIRATPDDPPEESQLPAITSDFAYSQLVLPLARKHEIDWKLVTAVMATESNFNPKAISRKGAQGLMQLMPGTARIYHVDDPYDPTQNIEAGARHLKMLLERYQGKLELVLAAYNSGEKAVDFYRGIPPFAETRTYVKRVLQLYRSL